MARLVDPFQRPRHGHSLAIDLTRFRQTPLLESMKSSYLRAVVVSVFLLHHGPAIRAAEILEADVIVYGGTSAGVVAAVQARRMGKSVLLVGPDVHLGGLSSGGLGWTDTGNKAVIGGLAREFYHRIWKHYQDDDAWTWQTREEYGGKGQGTRAIDGDRRTMWIFEPHVAEGVFDDLVEEHDIPVRRDEWLDRTGDGVTKREGRITAIRMLSGTVYRGKVFLDATYEGDLLAATGVSYHVGRESNDTYGETWNGVQTGVLHHRHHFGVLFPTKISPYRVPGDPASGVLPRISTEPPGEKGSGDHRVQAYCYRMCLSRHPGNRVPFPKPDGYDAAQYELLLRIFEAGWRDVFHKFDPIPNLKTDTNNHGPFSTDNIGMNYDYPEGSYERRREILAEHTTYQQGLMYFLANDPRVPAEIRERMAQWGLAADEFVDNGHWPHQIYVREARRMIGRYVMTEHDCLSTRETPEPVGMGSYTIDSHNCQRYITPEGYVQNEGDIGVRTGGPYQIAYGALVPKAEECTNLLVPVCASASHIAFGSIRMEPVFMILGQSAATAAALAVDGGIPVQDVDYSQLRERLLADGQILEYDGPRGRAGPHRRKGLDPSSLPGAVLDDGAAATEGFWKPSSSTAGFVGSVYLHDDDINKGASMITWRFSPPDPGRYEVRLSYTPHGNRASNVPVSVVRNGEMLLQTRIDQREKPPVDDHWVRLGSFPAVEGDEVTVTLTNANTDGYVIADAVQFLSLESSP